MTPSTNEQFNHYYALHCKHLKLKGQQPKTIEAYTRAIRRIGLYFDYQIADLSYDQLLDYCNGQLFQSTRKLSYRIFFFTLYSLGLGLRLVESLRLQVGDIDQERMRVHIRMPKGTKID
jgi:integrase/recombinase XerD